MEQHRVGVEQEIVQEDAADRDAGQVDVPARVLGRVEIEVLDQQDVADRKAEPRRHLQRP